MKTDLFTLIKLPIQEILLQNGEVHMEREDELRQGYLVQQDNSLLFDQIERLRGKHTTHISEVILVVAKKNPKQESKLRHLLTNGFTYNGVHYSRFGKSASQAKEGITAFVCDEMAKALYPVSQMDIEVEECVISKYEAQRCLLFSSCTLIKDYLPHIVIIGEYQKTLSHQLIRYVVEQEQEYTDKETGEKKSYIAREIKTGYRDIPLSPFDGCGCHELEFMGKVSQTLGLDYSPVGCQIRMPFLKGYSVYVPFRRILREWGYEYITDIYGQTHHIDDIDCIWNISMFKGHKLFQDAYGENAWKEYCNTYQKYHFSLGISKYSHHTRHLPRKTRMNFQYLQCLDLWNPKYIHCYEQGSWENYDILSPDTQGKIIELARYTTDLFEKIIQGDRFYTCKFFGIADSQDYEPASKYMEAILINDTMRKDPAVKQFLYHRLKKAIKEAKLGKIYGDGFYHTVVGDMLGYLEYATGKEPTGCLHGGEFYCTTMDKGECVSFRSPLICPSEVNKIRITSNPITEKWFSHFENQDIVMLNMYDLSAPQQGGMDYDGDIVLLCNEPIVVNSKINKPIIIDMEDKAAASPKPYTLENLVEYEIMTRDSRIGEITNVATSIENKYTRQPQQQELYDDYISLLRLYQGKEIDFLKTGLRWYLNNGMRKHLNQLPYFLLFHYPKKQKLYEDLVEKNKKIKEAENKYPLNAYHSPSPMNELCDYISTWERKHVLWNSCAEYLPTIRKLVLNPDFPLTDRRLMRSIRHAINDYANELREYLNNSEDSAKNSFNHELHVQSYKERLSREIQLNEEVIANYVIQVSYSTLSISKALAWAGYGDYILGNLKRNSPKQTRLFIQESPNPNIDTYEYLGKYYTYQEEIYDN